MEFLKILLKVLFILASVILMASPFLLEAFTFSRDKEKKISYKRFRMVIYTLVYVIVITVALYLLKDLVLWLESLSAIKWISQKIALPARLVYFGKVIVAVLVNFAIGILFVFLSKFVRIGMKKKNLVTPKKKDGEFTWGQKIGRAIIRFFHTETWFFVGNILKYLSPVLSAVYALVFVAYLAPGVFGADWIPYDFISMLFGSGYIYPTITLLALWEMYFFLEGIKRVEEECPEILSDDEMQFTKTEVDLVALDEEVRKQFKDYYVCDINLSKAISEEVASAEHHDITKFIAEAIENDKRNPQISKEVYLNCLDKMIENDKSILVNGSFFSEFSMYFLRYLSIIIARGDNVVFVCNNDSQIDEVYKYLEEGLAELSSLFCKGFKSDAVDFDDPIWRIVKINGESDVIEEATIDDNSILVTTLSYICSTHFESEHSKFIHLIDTVVFVDALKTVNTFNRQLAMLNTRLKHITKNNALLSKNGNINDDFRVRYMSKQVRYVCFDDTRTSGLDKVLKNLLAVDFESVDSMNFNARTLVRCYNYEGRVDEYGRRTCPQFLDSEEEIGALMNMAVLCLAKGASNVSVFADEEIPYANIEETISANMGRVSIKADGSNIHLNKSFYNPDDYSVLIVMDSGNNLPAALRRYISMVSDKPALIIVFSRPYMMRDYYVNNIDEIWSSLQLERIPVEEGTKKDVAQCILVKANAGGISEEEILRLAAGVSQFEPFVKKRDVNSILRAVIEVYGITQKEHINLFQYFEYTSSQDFDENGVYNSEDKVLLRRQGKLFDMINGRDMVIMSTSEKEIVLPLPRKRLTQNYIVGQNLLYNGNIYYINKIDTDAGKIFTRLAVGGKNDEAYEYIQKREYRVEFNSDPVETLFPTKHVVLKQTEKEVEVNDIYLSVFRAPTEVITYGYYKIDPHTLATNSRINEYHSISDPGNDELAKQTYRRYGTLSAPYYSSESIIKSTTLNANEKGAMMMSIRIGGKFGKDINKTMSLASVMLSELLSAMFPSVSDSIAVCPVLHGDINDEEAQVVLQKQSAIKISGESELISDADFNLVIIEDSPTDLGVVSVLMSAGDDALRTLFNPIFNYLEWYYSSSEKSDYLYFGLDHEPSCFDFDALHKLAKILGDDKHDLKFVDLDSVMEYAVCDFCGKRYAKGDDIIELDDGRKMCKSCAANLVGNNKKIIKAHMDRAKIFLESTYGIVLDEDYEFCFESTVKIANILKQNRDLVKRGGDAPLKSYIDDKKKVHIEYSIPSVNLSELLVRELTHVWQLKHIPDIAEDLAEGHIALVAIQYLRFLNQNSLASVRTTYYESTRNLSGDGYRKLVRALLENPQFKNNPFRYLLEKTGGVIDDDVMPPPAPRVIETGDYGLTYVPENFDRVLNGKLNYFYYSRLTATYKRAYDVLLNAIMNHDAGAIVEGCSFDDMVKISDAVAYDHPELFWYNTFSMRGSEINIYYGASAEEVEVLQRRIDEVVPKYLEGIDDKMSAYDVALHLHAKIISSVDYDTIALNKQQSEGGPSKDKIDYLRTICGVFLDGKAVCEGYARAMQYLLQKCGVESAEAAGFILKENGERDGGHAWNIVKIDGDYYYMDSTWDDSSNTVQTVKSDDVGFKYFCITTEELTRTRDLSLNPTDMPNCTATRGNYYYHNDLVLDSYDLDKIKIIAQTAAKNNSKSFTFKCTGRSLFEQTMAQLCSEGQDCYETLKAAAKHDKQILTNTYSYSYDKNIFTITVKFKYK